MPIHGPIDVRVIQLDSDNNIVRHMNNTFIIDVTYIPCKISQLLLQEYLAYR